jgi:hypothetical protein
LPRIWAIKGRSGYHYILCFTCFSSLVDLAAK